MGYKPGETIYHEFSTYNPAAQQPATPSIMTAAFVKNGQVDATVTVDLINQGEVGLYIARAAIPADYTSDDVVQIRISATVAGYKAFYQSPEYPLNGETTTGTPTVDGSGVFSAADFADLVKAPKKTRTDEAYIEERSVDELIKARNQVLAEEAATGVPWGMRVAKSKPPGTVSD